MPWFLVVVFIGYLISTFLFSVQPPKIITLIFVSLYAAFIGLVLYSIIALNQPYKGLTNISAEPLQIAYNVIKAEWSSPRQNAKDSAHDLLKKYLSMTSLINIAVVIHNVNKTCFPRVAITPTYMHFWTSEKPAIFILYHKHKNPLAKFLFKIVYWRSQPTLWLDFRFRLWTYHWNNFQITSTNRKK